MYLSTGLLPTAYARETRNAWFDTPNAVPKYCVTDSSSCLQDFWNVADYEHKPKTTRYI